MTVTIPNKKLDGYTLFASGKPYDIAGEEKTVLAFCDNTVVILYYTLPHTRRAYIVHSDGNQLMPNVMDRVSVIYKARGRKIDVLKTAEFILDALCKDGEQYTFPYGFWIDVGHLINTYKCNKKTITTLMHKHHILRCST